jgi:hypothetical protein
MPPKRLDNLLNPNADEGLGSIVRRAREMESLVEALRGALPPDDAAGLAGANLRDDGELVVLAESPAWAARLRFAEERLIEAARKTGATVTGCKVRVSRR